MNNDFLIREGNKYFIRNGLIVLLDLSLNGPAVVVGRLLKDSFEYLLRQDCKTAQKARGLYQRLKNAKMPDNYHNHFWVQQNDNDG